MIAIIGGGITGLTAAWTLQKAGVPYTLLEASDRWGGKIQTDHVDGFTIERAADAFLTAQKPWAIDLARELGLDEQILPTNDDQRRVFVVKDGVLVPLPTGLYLIVPTNAEALLASPLLSAAGKERMLDEETLAPDLVIGEDGSLADMSVADFVRRRVGQEALETLAEPLLSGIYNADPAEQSMMATFPRFPQMVQQHGSLIAGMRAAQARAAAAAKKSGGDTKKTAAFISFVGGTELLTKTLAQKLTGDCRLRTCVGQLWTGPAPNEYRLALSDGTELTANGVIIATPAANAAQLLRPLSPNAAKTLDELRTVSTGTISMAFRREQIEHPLDGFGVVIPTKERRKINAITWTSTKFTQRAPADHVLLRVFFGGVRTPDLMHKEDAEVLATARQELSSLMGVNAEPLFYRIYRWWDAQPQYDVGHLDRVAAIEAALPPNLFVAGCPFGGVGIPDCVRQGQEAAAKVIGELCK